MRLGFVPEEWFQAFYNKTGVTGPYAFAFTLSTYLVSKEIYVLEHEFYSGLSILIMWTYGIKKFGPKVAAFLDKDIDVSCDVESEIHSQVGLVLVVFGRNTKRTGILAEKVKRKLCRLRSPTRKSSNGLLKVGG